MRHAITPVLAIVAIVAISAMGVSPAAAWEIDTGRSDPCHERITLGAFGIGEAPFVRPDGDRLSATFDLLVERAAEVGVPGDRTTDDFIASAAGTFGFTHFDRTERWVMASLIAGARHPDTQGKSLLQLRSTRATHIDAERQALHSLRRPSHDGPAGDAQAVADARRAITETLRRAHRQWHADAITEAEWVFPFRGRTDVRVFAAAFEFGRAAHTIQDAYTHMLRDADGAVVTVLNYAEAVWEGHERSRDGLRHSGRLDRCEAGDAFDAARIRAAGDATMALQRAANATLGEATFDDGALTSALDRVYTLREGCTVANDYCDTAWLEPALQSQTEPIRLWFCAASDGAPPGWAWLALVLFGCMRWRRERR